MQMSLNQMDMNVVMYPEILELYQRKEALKVNLGWIILNTTWVK
jgi:hypothetical protein